MPITDLNPDEEVPPGAVVLRFTPASAEGVLRSARNSHADAGSADDPRYHASVYVDIAATDPNDIAVVTGLLEAAELSGIQPPPRNKHYFVTTADVIQDLGFVFKKDRYTEEHVKHYSVDLGEAPTSQDAERFLSAFVREGSKRKWQ